MDDCMECNPPKVDSSEEEIPYKEMHLKDAGLRLLKFPKAPRLPPPGMARVTREYIAENNDFIRNTEYNLNGPERPGPYSSRALRKRYIENYLYRLHIGSNIPLDVGSMRKNIHKVYKNCGLLPGLARAHLQEDGVSIFHYLPFQHIVKEYVMKASPVVTAKWPIGLNPYEPEFFDVLTTEYVKTHSSKVLDRKTRFCSRRFLGNVGLDIAFWAFTRRLERKADKMFLVNFASTHAQLPAFVEEVRLRRDIVHDNREPASLHRHEVLDLDSKKGSVLEFLASGTSVADAPEFIPEWALGPQRLFDYIPVSEETSRYIDSLNVPSKNRYIPNSLSKTWEWTFTRPSCQCRHCVGRIPCRSGCWSTINPKGASAGLAITI